MVMRADFVFLFTSSSRRHPHQAGASSGRPSAGSWPDRCCCDSHLKMCISMSHVSGSRVPFAPVMCSGCCVTRWVRPETAVHDCCHGSGNLLMSTRLLQFRCCGCCCRNKCYYACRVTCSASWRSGRPKSLLIIDANTAVAFLLLLYYCYNACRVTGNVSWHSGRPSWWVMWSAPSLKWPS
jgi:hypothetical protein